MKTEAAPLERHKHEQWFGQVNQYLPLLYRFLRQEISYLEATGELAQGELNVDDIADSVLLEVQREFSKDPNRHPSRAWLLRHARERIEAQRRQLKLERGIPHIEEDIFDPTGDSTEPALDQGIQIYLDPEYLKLEHVIPDIKVPTPEHEAEVHELWACVSRVVATMSPAWRQLVTLHYVEGFTLAELAEAIHRPVSDTQRLLEQARDSLRKKLVDAGCRLREEGDTRH
jgi:RNA polymerase sigma factor (sigma-70 family)